MKEGICSVLNIELPLFKIRTNPIDQESVKIDGVPPLLFLDTNKIGQANNGTK